jgi:hypothetical protein
MASFVLKLDCTLHLNGAPPRPKQAAEWEGAAVNVPERMLGSPQITIATGDKLIIWTHEDKSYGSGQGLTATAIAGSIAEVAGQKHVTLRDVRLITPHLRLNDIARQAPTSALLEELRAYRLLHTRAIDEAKEAEFWTAVDQILATRRALLTEVQARENTSPARIALEQDAHLIAAEYQRRMVEVRPQQAQFRQTLIALYSGKCLFSGSKVLTVLQAAHIVPFSEEIAYRNDPSNGLLLRADFHLLFDAALIAVQPESGKLVIAPELQGTLYEKSAGRLVLHQAKPEFIERHFTEWSSRHS